MKLVKTPGLVRRIFPRQTTGPGNPKKPTLYLTFDDAPQGNLTQEIIRILNNKNVKATFFCVGQNMEKHPLAFQQIIDNNHTVGNHTYSHLNGWETSLKEYISDTRKFQKLYNAKLFRPPYGRISAKQYFSMRKMFHIVLWSILSRDFDPQITPEKCLKNVIENLHNGAIIVFHDNPKASKQMLYALPRTIDYAREKGYIFSSF